MADAAHLEQLAQGVAAWNAWRAASPRVLPDLQGAMLKGSNLKGANLDDAKNLQCAHLDEAQRDGARLNETDVRGASMIDTELPGAGEPSGAVVADHAVRQARQNRRLGRTSRALLVFQPAEVAVLRALFAAILSRIDRLRGPPVAAV